jgi:hypothetical protein
MAGVPGVQEDGKISGLARPDVQSSEDVPLHFLRRSQAVNPGVLHSTQHKRRTNLPISFGSLDGIQCYNQKFSPTDLFLPLNVLYEIRIQIEYASFRRLCKGIRHHDTWIHGNAAKLKRNRKTEIGLSNHKIFELSISDR